MPTAGEFHLRPVGGFSYLLAGLILVATVFLRSSANFFPDTPFREDIGSWLFAYWSIAFGAVPAVAALIMVKQLVTAAVWLTDGGRLTVRSWPRWRERSVELTLLRSIDAEPHVNIGFYDDSGKHSPPIDCELFRERRTTLLTLTDAAGGQVRVNPFFWQDTPSLVGAIRAAALRTHAEATPAAREYLSLDADRGPD